MIDIFGRWIDEFGVDGFRIDTARHVNPQFWQQFVPAMKARAAARGIPNFHIFGEVYTDQVDPAYTAARRALIGERASLELRPGSPGGQQPRLPTHLGTHAAGAQPGLGEPTVAYHYYTRQ